MSKGKLSSNNNTSFIYMGDPQCSRISGTPQDYTGWGALLARAIRTAEGRSGDLPAEDDRQRPLLILGGDIVNRGGKSREEEWASFFAAKANAEEDTQTGILMATPVNGAEESIGSCADQFLNPGNGPAGYEKEFFSFDYGCCHFIFLNSDYMGNRRETAVSFICDWIVADLKTNSKPAVFVVMHHPMVTVGTSFEDDVRAAAMRENHLELLWEAGVDFILCGHQHVYCRTREHDDDAEGGCIPQIMGVSGTKYFEAEDKAGMAAVCENVSVATLFETDGETIRLKTIDVDGVILDEYSQNVRRAEAENCAAPANPDARTKRTGRRAEGGSDPLRPANSEGISVCVSGDCREEIVFSEEALSSIRQIDVRYSVMRRGRLEYEDWRGLQLSALLGNIEAKAGQILVLTDSRGRQKVLPLGGVIHAWRYEQNEETEPVPAVIAREDGGYRLIYGQQAANQYNGRGWMRDIRRIEVFSGSDISGKRV